MKDWLFVTLFRIQMEQPRGSTHTLYTVLTGDIYYSVLS